MILPFLTSAYLTIDEDCPECNTKLSLKISYNGVPFIACDKCNYKRELILFRKCPKCKGNLKLIHKYEKFKCENCNTWFKFKLMEESSLDLPDLEEELERLEDKAKNLIEDIKKLKARKAYLS